MEIRFNILSWDKPRSVCRTMIKLVRNLIGNLEKFNALLKSANKIGFRNLYWVISHTEITTGHLNSAKTSSSVDYKNNPLPWYTYPAIEYLIQFEFKDKRVFEYGCGNSSLFWASRAQSVTSVESDKEWFEIVETKQLKNQELLFRTTQAEYVQAIEEKNEDYDAIIIDGKWRYYCAVNAVDKLKDDGFIILDNSDWYPNTAKFIRNTGLLQVDFNGLGPINYYTWTTSIFFKPKTRLNPIDNIQPHNGLGSLHQVAKDDLIIN